MRAISVQVSERNKKLHPPFPDHRCGVYNCRLVQVVQVTILQVCLIRFNSVSMQYFIGHLDYYLFSIGAVTLLSLGIAWCVTRAAVLAMAQAFAAFLAAALFGHLLDFIFGLYSHHPVKDPIRN